MMKKILFPAILLLSVISGYAAGNYPSGGKTMDFPEIGIRARLFRDAEARPLPTINRVTLLGKEQVNLLEWFLHDQHAGVWRGPGFEIVAAKMTRNYPELDTEMVAPEVAEEHAPVTDRMTGEQIDAYIRRFSKADFIAKEADKSLNPEKKVTRYDFRPFPDGVFQVGYLAESIRYPGRKMYILYRFAEGMDVKRSLAAARASFYTLEFKPSDMYVSDGSEKERKPYKRKRPTNTSFEASRERVINNIRSYPDWWFQETENFIVVSNMKSDRNIAVLLDTLEKCRGAYEAYFPSRLQNNDICTVRFFEKRDDYAAYVGAMGETTIGIWMPSKKELAVSPIDFFNRSANRAMMENTVCHEAWHQYIHFAVGEAPNAMWFNEGCARYFEGLDINSPRHSVELTQVLEDGIAYALNQFRGRDGKVDAAGVQEYLERLLRMDQAAFYGPDIQNNYSFAGAMLYFLFRSGDPAYRKVPDLFYEKLLETRDWNEATTEAWKGIDMKKFTEDFVAFFGSKQKLRAAARVDPLRKQPSE